MGFVDLSNSEASFVSEPLTGGNAPFGCAGRCISPATSFGWSTSDFPLRLNSQNPMMPINSKTSAADDHLTALCLDVSGVDTLFFGGDLTSTLSKEANSSIVPTTAEEGLAGDAE